MLIIFVYIDRKMNDKNVTLPPKVKGLFFLLKIHLIDTVEWTRLFVPHGSPTISRVNCYYRHNNLMNFKDQLSVIFDYLCTGFKRSWLTLSTVRWPAFRGWTTKLLHHCRQEPCRIVYERYRAYRNRPRIIFPGSSLPRNGTMAMLSELHRRQNPRHSEEL